MIIDLQNIPILGAKQAHQPLIVHLQINQHLIHADVGTEIFLDQLVHLVSLLLQILAGDADPDLLAPNQVLLEALGRSWRLVCGCSRLSWRVGTRG